MGQMPQTLEHQLLASQFGIKHIVFYVLYVNKVDLMLFDKDTLHPRAGRVKRSVSCSLILDSIETIALLFLDWLWKH